MIRVPPLNVGKLFKADFSFSLKFQCRRTPAPTAIDHHLKLQLHWSKAGHAGFPSPCCCSDIQAATSTSTPSQHPDCEFFDRLISLMQSDGLAACSSSLLKSVSSSESANLTGRQCIQLALLAARHLQQLTHSPQVLFSAGSSSEQPKEGLTSRTEEGLTSRAAAMILVLTSRGLHQNEIAPCINDLISLASVRAYALNHELSSFEEEDEWWCQWMGFAVAKVSTLTTTRISGLLNAWTARQSTSSHLNKQCEVFVRALEAQLLTRLRQAPEADVMTTVLATSAGNWNPSSEWIETIIVARASSLTRQSLISLSVHMAKAKTSVSPVLSNVLAATAASHLNDISGKEVSWMLWALGRYRAPIRWRVLSVVLDHYKSVLPTTAIGDMARVVQALPVLSRYPSGPNQVVQRRRSLLTAIVHHSKDKLLDCQPHDLVLLITGFNRLGFYPGAMWMKQHREACLMKQNEFDGAAKQRVRAAYQVHLTKTD